MKVIRKANHHFRRLQISNFITNTKRGINRPFIYKTFRKIFKRKNVDSHAMTRDLGFMLTLIDFVLL